jgi:hypothetical protein
MTGARFKSIAVKTYGTFGWVKLTAQYLDCNPSTVWRYAQAATVPDHIEVKIKAMPMKGKT